MRPVEWKLLHGGYCVHLERMVDPMGNFRKRKFPALFSFILHPTLGPMLFDTGYSKHFFTETAKIPYRFYRWITPVTLRSHESAQSQVQLLGYSPEDIKYIILSHLHADHIAGCKDFSQATFICSRVDYEHVKTTKGLNALRRGFIPALLPDNWLDRVNWIEDCPLVSVKEKFQPFSHAFDLFSDDTLLAVHLPGHSPGQFGIFLQNTSRQTIFLAADSCWLTKAYEQNRMPHPITNALASNITDYKNSLKKVHQLSQTHPKIKIIPSHCLETWEEYYLEETQ